MLEVSIFNTRKPMSSEYLFGDGELSESSPSNRCSLLAAYALACTANTLLGNIRNRAVPRSSRIFWKLNKHKSAL
jgi:hypothetical protein